MTSDTAIATNRAATERHPPIPPPTPYRQAPMGGLHDPRLGFRVSVTGGQNDSDNPSRFGTVMTPCERL